MKGYTFVDYATQIYSLIAAGLILAFHNQTVPAWGWLLAAHAVGLAAVHLLVRAGSRPHPSKALEFLRHFYPVLLYLFFFSETGWTNLMFFPNYLDPIVAGWDQALFGCQPGIVWMEKLPWAPLSELLYASYFSYYIMIVGMGVALFLRNRPGFFHYISVLSFVLYVCYVVFIIIPIIGPRTFFEPVNGYMMPPEYRHWAPDTTYPAGIQAGWFFRLMGLVYRLFEAPGSSIPSSHVAVAICTVYFSFRYLRAIRYPHAVLAGLLCVATVYCRYHFLVDALAGVLTAAILVPLGNWLYFRFSPPRFPLARGDHVR